MSFSTVQVVANSGSSSTPSATFGGGMAASDLLVAVFSWNQRDNNAAVASSPSGMTLWPNADGDKNINGACHHACYYKIAAGAEATVSANLTKSVPWRVVLIQKHDSAAGTWAIDKTESATGNTDKPLTGLTGTTSAAVEWCVGALTHKNTQAYTITSSEYSSVNQGNSADSDSDAVRVLVAEFISSSPTQTQLKTSLSEVKNWVGSIATFQSYVAPTNQTVSVPSLSATPIFGAIDSYSTYPTETVPVFTLQMAVTSRPRDDTYDWVDVTTYGRDIQWQRGRQNQLNRIEAGTSATVVRDESRIFDPDNTDSDFYPYVLPMMPIRLVATIGINRYYCFEQFIESWTRVRIGPNYAERNLPSVDAYGLFALADLAGISYPVELAGARLHRVLDTIGWPESKRVIASGQALMGELEVADNSSVKALQHIQDVADGESGLAFIDGHGRFVFLDRYTQLGPPYSESLATFSDIPVSGSGGSGSLYGAGTYGAGLYGAGAFGAVTEYRYTNAVPNYGNDLIINDWKGSRPEGTTQNASDITSQDDYGRRSQSISSVLADDNELASQLQYKLTQFKDPLQRIEQIDVMPGVDVDLWKLLLGFEIGDRITVKEHPPGGGPASVRDYTIQRIAVGKPVGPALGTTFTFQLWPGETGDWFIFDDTVKGRLDSNRLSY